MGGLYLEFLFLALQALNCLWPAHYMKTPLRRYNKLFTVTAQCLESELPRYRSTLQATVNSFTPPPPVF